MKPAAVILYPHNPIHRPEQPDKSNEKSPASSMPGALTLVESDFDDLSQIFDVFYHWIIPIFRWVLSVDDLAATGAEGHNIDTTGGEFHYY